MSVEDEERSLPAVEREDWSKLTKERVDTLLTERPVPQVGYLVWTKHELGKRAVEEASEALCERGITQLRTGISWAEWVDPEGKEWIAWYLREYAKHFDLLPCLTFTPPALGIAPRVNSPPANFLLYGEFVEDVIDTCGETFEWIELWNEWNLETDWDQAHDPEYKTFMAMVALGAKKAHERGKKTVLGGMSNVNKETLKWTREFSEAGLVDACDAVAFHNLRGTWSDHVPAPPLPLQADLVKKAWKRGVSVWLTEYGFSVVETPLVEGQAPVSLEEMENMQVALFAYALYSMLIHSIERVYWYTYKDHVHQSLRAAMTGWEDVIQYYYGDTDEAGHVRRLGRLLMDGGPELVLRTAAEENLFPLVDRASLRRELKGN